MTRWLAGDPTLAEAKEQGTAEGYGQPYRVEKELCHTPEQLARLERWVEVMEAEGSAAAIAPDVDRTFHDTLYEPLDNHTITLILHPSGMCSMRSSQCFMKTGSRCGP